METLEGRIAAYAARKMPGARDVTVDQLDRIWGGASRETYRFRLNWAEGATRHSRRLVMKRDPPGDSLIDTTRATEYAVYKAFGTTPVPVPEVLWLEEDPAHLDQPFFVMAEVGSGIAGLDADPRAVTAEPYAAHAAEIGRQKWFYMGQIAAQDPHALGLVGVFPWVEPDQAWKQQLDYWEGVLTADELNPQPVIRAAIRWMRRNPPPPAMKTSVVHGDFRTGNYLYDPDGRIHGVLDWEMAHLGDPLEDLAWSINRVWYWGRDERCGGLIPKEDAIRHWEEGSGMKVDRAALHWWELFASVKGQGIWVSSAHAWETSENKDIILALTGWVMINAQDRAVLETMGHLEDHLA
ncbi:phosphotransferase family protein [Zavarzinia sp. CC-PAN008]|uniref:phosphotransferase family protein n=1 Tax=Zavarzinia sp. CC-PAN008 TaxID=3243332 RepID=UPI003F747213